MIWTRLRLSSVNVWSVIPSQCPFANLNWFFRPFLYFQYRIWNARPSTSLHYMFWQKISDQLLTMPDSLLDCASLKFSVKSEDRQVVGCKHSVNWGAKSFEPSLQIFVTSYTAVTISCDSQKVHYEKNPDTSPLKKAFSWYKSSTKPPLSLSMTTLPVADFLGFIYVLSMSDI